MTSMFPNLYLIRAEFTKVLLPCYEDTKLIKCLKKNLIFKLILMFKEVFLYIVSL